MSFETVLLSVTMAVAAGLVGCFAVMRRMALAADALSHVALPGIGIALALHFSPLFGAAAMLLFGALLVWLVETETRISAEAIIGVLFSTALAVGSMMTSGEELIDALFGKPAALSWPEILFGLVGSGAVIAFVITQRRKLVVMLVSPDVARTAGIPVRYLNLFYLEAFALTIALGLRFLGVLLMGALIIIPAVTAKRLARSLSGMMTSAVAIAVLATAAGTLAAFRLHRETGPLIVIAAAACFLISFATRREF